MSALSAQIPQCIGGFIFASCLFAVTTPQPSIKQFLLKPWQVLRVVNAVGIDMLQPYMVQGSYAIFIKEWFPMFEGPLANMFATFLHFPGQQTVYTSMVQSDGQHVVIPYLRHDCSLIRNDIIQLHAGLIKVSFTRPTFAGILVVRLAAQILQPIL